MLELTEIAKALTAVGLIGGGALTLNALHEPKGEVDKARAEFRAETRSLQTDLRVDRIRNLVKDARAENSPDYLCDALEAEIIQLCTSEPEHYLCKNNTPDELIQRAGCR